jgi:predicted dehydrogenase
MQNENTEGERLAVAVVGCGYWGPNYVRNFNENPGSRVVAVVDQRQDRLDAVKRRYPGIRMGRDLGDVLEDDEVEAVAIATPISTHFALATAALEAGKHVVVAKPMATTAAEAELMRDTARTNGRVLLVDHTFVYGSPVRHIREMLDQGVIGEPYYFDSVRVNLGLFQEDVNVVWDLAAHDLSIATFLFGNEPLRVHAVGASHSPSGHEDVAYVTLTYPGSLIAHCHVNWLSPVKIRQTLLAGSERMLVWNDLAADELIKVYDHGVTMSPDREGIYKLLVDYRMGDVWIPHIERFEALSALVSHFVDCVRGDAAPITGPDFGVRVMHMLEAAAVSLRQGGQPVDLAAVTAR